MTNLEIFVTIFCALIGYFSVSKFLNRNNKEFIEEEFKQETKSYLPGRTMSQEEFEAAKQIFEENKRSYLKTHWRGEHSLSKSFWLNFIVLNLIILLVGAYWGFVGPRTEDPVFLARFYLAFTIVGYVVIYPWQVVGLWRSASRYSFEKNKRFWPTLVKLFIVFGALSSIAQISEDKALYEELYSNSFNLSKKQSYDVYIKDNRIYLSGVLDYGISDQVEELIDNYPRVNSIALNSIGGLLYEGSKISDLILLNSLDTFAFNQCLSACTIAFISGNKRYIAEGAKLGFHQYSYDRPQSQLEKIALSNLQNEDAFLFRKRGVNEKFIQIMFQATPDEMWYPTDQDLFNYGVVTNYTN